MDYYKKESIRRNTVVSIIYGILKKLFMMLGGLNYENNLDDKSREYNMKKQLRCAVSGCFDKYNICCKACDIKRCRYKCDFINLEVCEHEYWE